MVCEVAREAPRILEEHACVLQLGKLGLGDLPTRLPLSILGQGAFYFQPNAVPSSTCRPPASWPSIGRTPPRRSEPRSRAPAHGGGRGEEPELLSLFLSIILSRATATKRRQKRTGGQERKATKIQKRRPRYAGRSAAGGKQRATKKGRGAEPKGGREVHIVHGLRTASDCIMQIVFSPTKRSRSCAPPSTLVDTLTDYHL
jgi:hypothetical protein